MTSTLSRHCLALLLPGVLLGGGCASIGPGQIGVLWRASGGTQKQTYGEGLHSVAGWDQMWIYDLHSKSHDEMLHVIAVNGLSIDLDASVRHHIIPDEVVALHEQLGPGYYQTIMEPVVRSEARRVFGRYTPEEIYSTKRDAIEREIRTEVEAKIAGKHIVLEAVLIRNVELPAAIRQAIDQKLAAEQEVLKMRYVLEVTKAAAEEKRIEAQGIADYNRALSASLSPSILEFERIQQMTRLAASNNAKTVVIGPGNRNTPVVLSAPGETHAR